jgi:hypothetical protein
MALDAADSAKRQRGLLQVAAGKELRADHLHSAAAYNEIVPARDQGHHRFALTIFFSFASNRSLLSSAPRRRATETKSSASLGRWLVVVVFRFREGFALDCDFIRGISLVFKR